MEGVRPSLHRPMTTEIARQDVDSLHARILCVGDDVEHLLEMLYQLDSDFDFVVVSRPDEGPAVLANEGPFDVIISDGQTRSGRGARFTSLLRAHSPDAERLILAVRDDRATRAMAASDGRVMRVLLRPCPANVLREAVSDALLRHRARCLRAATAPRVTPTSGHPCGVYHQPPDALGPVKWLSEFVASRLAS